MKFSNSLKWHSSLFCRGRVWGSARNVKYRENTASAVQKQLKRLRCRLGCSGWALNEWLILVACIHAHYRHMANTVRCGGSSGGGDAACCLITVGNLVFCDLCNDTCCLLDRPETAAYDRRISTSTENVLVSTCIWTVA